MGCSRQQVAMGNMIQPHQEMDGSKQQQCLDVPPCCRDLSSAYAHSAASAQRGPQVGSAMGSSLLSPLARATPAKKVLNVDARDQHSPGYNRAVIKTVPWQCTKPCLTAPVG